MTVEAAPEEALRRDVAWADIVLPDGELVRRVRAFITNRRLRAYGDAPQGGVVLRVDLALVDDGASVQRSRQTLGAGERLEVNTTAGVAFVNRAAGCACHSSTRYLGTPVPW